MSQAMVRMDELVRDYLLYRGFTGTLKVLDAEIKTDKDKGFRVGAKFCSHVTLFLFLFT